MVAKYVIKTNGPEHGVYRAVLSGSVEEKHRYVKVPSHQSLPYSILSATNAPTSAPTMGGNT